MSEEKTSLLLGVSEEKTSLPQEGGGPPLVVEGVAHSFNRSDAGTGSQHGSGQVGGTALP